MGHRILVDVSSCHEGPVCTYTVQLTLESGQSTELLLLQTALSFASSTACATERRDELQLVQ